MKGRGLWMVLLAVSLHAQESNQTQPPKQQPQGQARASAPVAVSTDKVEVGGVGISGSFAGTLYFEMRSSLASETSGSVEAIYVEAGDRVAQGMVLAKLSSDLLEKDIAAKEASLKQATAQARKVQREFERIEKLHESQSVSYKEYENALYDKEAQESNLLAITSDLAKLKVELQKKSIKAPYDGIVLEKLLDKGDWAGTGSALFKIAKSDPMEARVDLPFEVMRILKIGQKVNLSIAGKAYEGAIKAIVPQGDVKARTFPVRISISNLAGDLFEGLEVTARFQSLNQEEGVLVHRDSILPRGNQNVIFIVKEGKAQMIPVQVVRYEGYRALIKAQGVTSGDRVVLRGQERLRSGQEVVEAR